MVHTPKSERQLNKAGQVSDRWTQRSYANLHTDGHPAHKKQVTAVDRERQKWQHNARDFDRHVRRDQRERGAGR